MKTDRKMKWLSYKSYGIYEIFMWRWIIVFHGGFFAILSFVKFKALILFFLLVLMASHLCVILDKREKVIQFEKIDSKGLLIFKLVRKYKSNLKTFELNAICKKVTFFSLEHNLYKNVSKGPIFCDKSKLKRLKMASMICYG